MTNKGCFILTIKFSGISCHSKIVLCHLQNAVVSIAKVEDAYKCEIEIKAVIKEAVQQLSLDELLDDMDTDEDVDQNRLLPAINKLWPYLVICLKNKISMVQFLHI